MKNQTVQLETPRLSLTFGLDKVSGKCRVRFEDKRTHLRLESGLAEVEFMWDAVPRIELAQDLQILGIRQSNRRQAVIRGEATLPRIAFDLLVTLDEDEFTVTVPWKNIVEKRREHYRLYGLRPLPGLLRNRTPGGTFLVPVKCGALIYPSRHPGLKDALLNAGEQSRWEDLPLLPVCALFERGAGLAVIAELGDCDALFEIAVDHGGSGTAGFSTRYRYLWRDPVDGIDRTFRYVPLDESCADYSGVGRRLNRYLRESCGMPTLAKKIERAPELAYLSRAMVMKTFHGMKELGHENGDGKFHLFQTFAETKTQLKKLKTAGVENVHLQMVGWNIDGHDGRYPVRFPIDPRVGGERGFKDLIRYGQKLGYQMQVHDCYSDVYACAGKGFHPEHTITSLYGGPLAHGLWAGGTNYLVNPLKIGEADAPRDMLRLKKLGVAGTYYLDAMGPPLEVDYDPVKGGPRRHHAEGIAWILDLGRKVFGSCGTENGFFYAARASDYMGGVPYQHDPAEAPMISVIGRAVDEYVPLWHLTFHGMLVHSAGDAHAPGKRALLLAAETGGAPRSDFSGANPEPGGNLFAGQWDDRLLPAYKAKYDILIGRLGKNQTALIQQHTNLGGERYETVFANGATVRVDYASLQLWLDGCEVRIPEGFDLDVPFRK